MDIFQFDGFLGDMMTVNLTYKPYFEVERRKYRFRILNASVSRFFKICLSDGAESSRSPMTATCCLTGSAYRARRAGHRRAL